MEHSVSPKANDTKKTDCLASLCPITNTRELIVIYQQRGLIKVEISTTGLPPESETIKSRDIANTEREGNSMMTTRSFRLIAAICLASIVALSQFDRVDGQASNKVEGESATASNNKDNVSRRRKGVALRLLRRGVERRGRGRPSGANSRKETVLLTSRWSVGCAQAARCRRAKPNSARPLPLSVLLAIAATELLAEGDGGDGRRRRR